MTCRLRRRSKYLISHLNAGKLLSEEGGLTRGWYRFSPDPPSRTAAAGGSGGGLGPEYLKKKGE